MRTYRRNRSADQREQERAYIAAWRAQRTPDQREQDRAKARQASRNYWAKIKMIRGLAAARGVSLDGLTAQPTYGLYRRREI
jgi:hypothetical protein